MQVITTRSYDERLDTIAAVREAGISVCSGGILGLGETDADRVGLIWELSKYYPLVPPSHEQLIRWDIWQPPGTPGIVPRQRAGPYPWDASGEKRGDHCRVLLWLAVLIGLLSRYRSRLCSERLRPPESSSPSRSSGLPLEDKR